MTKPQLTTQAATAVGALVVLFLFLTGNTLPMVVDGRVEGTLKGGWRDRFVIPEAGTFDRIGVVLLTVGLATQNLWSGQQRGVLVDPDAGAADLFLYCIALFGALRGLALFGPFVDPRQRAVPFIGCVVLIAAALILGILYPDTMGTLLLGVVPLFVGVLVLPLAMGRLLKVLQLDIGMSWQASFIVIAALAVERGANMLLVRMAQGQF